MNNPVLPKNYKTIKEMFMSSIKEYPNNIAFMEKRQGMDSFCKISYKKFGEDVIALGAALTQKLNLKDEKIVIIGENSYEWAVSHFAITCGVGIVVPIDKELPSNEIINLVKRSKAKCIIYSSKKREIIEQVKQADTNLKWYIEMYPNEETTAEYTIDNLIEIGKKLDQNKYKNIQINPKDFKILLFTSGTTQQAKGVMLNNENVMTNLNNAPLLAEVYDKEVFLSMLPLHHAYEGHIGMLFPIYCGYTIAFASSLKSISSDIKEIKPTVMLVVPALIENIIKKVNKEITKKHKDMLVNYIIKATNLLGNYGFKMKRDVLKEVHEALGGNLRIIVSAAAPIDKSVGQRLEDFGIMFIQGYGLTETSPLATLVPTKHRKLGSVGIPPKTCEVKINNPNEDGIGEVYIKGTNVALGYFENQEETTKAFADGWFHSGDLGYIDDEGYLYLTGRTKNLIITGNGKNVYPEEIEALVNKIKYVKESMVYAKTDPKDEHEQIVAVKVTLDDAAIKEEFADDVPDNEKLHELIWQEIKEVNRKLVTYKWIKELEIKTEDFKKTTTMKIKRYEELK